MLKVDNINFYVYPHVTRDIRDKRGNLFYPTVCPRIAIVIYYMQINQIHNIKKGDEYK